MNKQKTMRGLIKFNPIAASILLSLPMMAQAANIEMKNGTLTAANNVPVVNINTANGHGISHNIYDRLNVDKNGLILNNSQKGADTLLAGKIDGNSNLSAGTAKIILNEVTSRNKSTLNGMMEVAGDKAHLIIANPNGITVQGGGFINAEKATLTTGKPDMQDGELKGYSVNGGTATIGKLQSASPTEILARSVVVNGEIEADKLSVVAGNNYVNMDAQVTGSVTASGLRNINAIDVSSLGGMYANRISLVSTEKGVGVRNAGTIAGAAGGVQIDSNGRLINRNAAIKSLGDLSVKTNGALDNMTGTMASEKKIHIDTAKNGVNNTRAGNIVARSDVYLDSGAFDNTNGKVASGGMLALNTNNQTLRNSGKGNTVGISAGLVALQTGLLDNSNGQIKGQYVGAKVANVNNTNGSVEAAGNLDIVSDGNINNNRGLLRSSSGRVQLEAARTLANGKTKTADTVSTDSLGVLAGDGGIKITVGSLDNHGGQLASTGDISLETKGEINNLQGRVASGANIYAKANTLQNVKAGISAQKNLKIELASNLVNHIGVIGSIEGDIELKANHVNNNGGVIRGENLTVQSATGVNNSQALMVANKKLIIETAANLNNISGDTFGSAYGIFLGMANQKGGIVGREGVDITAKNIANGKSRIVAELGPLKLNVDGNIASNDALLASGAGNSHIKAKAFSSNYSTIYSAGNMTIDVDSLSSLSSGSMTNNNATGIIAADGNLALNVKSSFTNYGWITAKGDAAMNITGQLTNYNTILSDGNLSLDASSALTNNKDIVSAKALTMKTTGALRNNGSGNMVGRVSTTAQAQDITNNGNLVGDEMLTVNASRNIYNYGSMYSKGKAVIGAKIVTNSGSKTVLGGSKGTELNADRVIGNGIIVGM